MSANALDICFHLLNILHGIAAGLRVFRRSTSADSPRVRAPGARRPFLRQCSRSAPTPTESSDVTSRSIQLDGTPAVRGARMTSEHVCPVCSGPDTIPGQPNREVGWPHISHEAVWCVPFLMRKKTTERTSRDLTAKTTIVEPAQTLPWTILCELQNASDTIRHYEWKGLYAAFHQLCPGGGRWLDYGCGVGGLVSSRESMASMRVGLKKAGRPAQADQPVCPFSARVS
jgi:hypothetical protein